MYHYLKGLLAEKAPTSVVLDIGGVGYELQIPLSTYEQLPAQGQTARLLTHFVVREDAQTLYGFYTEEERRLFRLLISVSGIGPKSAITVLSGVSISELKKAIVEGALDVLRGISGIGRKTAERIVIELREKLVLSEQESASPRLSLLNTQDALIEDSLQALMALGYRKNTARDAIEKALKKAEDGKCSVEDLIRASLKYIA